MPLEQPQLLRRISLFYTIYLLYLEPLMALGGALIIFRTPHSFLQKTVPGYTQSPLTPITQMLLTNLAALYVLFAILEGVVLRLTLEKKVWVGVFVAMLVSDIGHLFAVYQIAPERFWTVWVWSTDEWVANGTLWLGAGLRFAFCCGVGR